jgi:hypothetical protein
MSPLFLVSYVLLWVMMIACFLGVFALYNHFGQMYMSDRLRRDEQGPAEGAYVNDAELSSLHGRTLIIPLPRPTLMVFSSVTCSVCSSLRAAAGPVIENHGVELVFICEGKERAVRAWASEVSPGAHVIADQGNKLGRKYGIDVVPFALAIDANGVVVAKGIVNGEAGLEFFAHQLIDDHAEGSAKQFVSETILYGNRK